MEQKETLLDNLFQDFQSSFNQAAPEEKRRLAAQFYPWAEQQMDSLGILAPNNHAGGVPEDPEHPPLTTPGAFQPKNRRDTFLQDIQNLVESEIQNREQTRIQSRVKAARFPTYKELADFDFSVLPNFNKARILDLARGEYITKHETLIFIGNPGLGKSHLTIALALTACRMGKRVRFWTAAGLVNELLL